MYEARASEIARGQLGGVFQTAFTLYMFVGNQLQLFNMMFLFTFGMGPINNLLALEKSECSAPAFSSRSVLRLLTQRTTSGPHQSSNSCFRQLQASLLCRFRAPTSSCRS